jgi:AcrR family transcriptional regulator
MTTSSTSAREPGRPTGHSNQRQAIADSATKLFADKGYERATIRAIASDARVDPALVRHYFGSKSELFAAVMSPPVNTRIVFREVAQGPRSEVGARLAVFVVALLEGESTRHFMLGTLRAASTGPEAAGMLRSVLRDQLIEPMAEYLATDTEGERDLRASMVVSQIIGVAMARYVVGIEPLASATTAQLAETLTPVLQYYLDSPLGK